MNLGSSCYLDVLIPSMDLFIIHTGHHGGALPTGYRAWRRTESRNREQHWTILNWIMNISLFNVVRKAIRKRWCPGLCKMEVDDDNIHIIQEAVKPDEGLERGTPAYQLLVSHACMCVWVTCVRVQVTEWHWELTAEMNMNMKYVRFRLFAEVTFTSMV